MDGTGRLFRWLLPAIHPETRAVVVSYPPDRFLGYRQLADLVAQQIPVGRYAIIAESFSGPVAAILASERPGGLRGVILSTSFVVPPAPRWLRFAPLEFIFRFRPATPLLRFLLLDPACGAEVVAGVADAIAATPSSVLASRVREVLSTDASEALQSCTVPVAYIAAAGDRVLGLRGLKAAKRARPDIESVILGGPHLLLQAKPRDAAAVINAHLQRWFAR
jgi:pimeloyl-ACP methyl ester carboxylesterase